MTFFAKVEKEIASVQLKSKTSETRYGEVDIYEELIAKIEW
jgi:hypothetical protein